MYMNGEKVNWKYFIYYIYILIIILNILY
jgi:hypothetical protein